MTSTKPKFTVRKWRFCGDEMLEPCKPVFTTADEEEAVNWMTGYVDSLSRQGKRGGEWAVFQDGEEMFIQSYGFGHKFANL